MSAFEEWTKRAIPCPKCYGSDKYAYCEHELSDTFKAGMLAAAEIAGSVNENYPLDVVGDLICDAIRKAAKEE